MAMILPATLVEAPNGPIKLAPLLAEHVGASYQSWLADPVVTRFTETRAEKRSLDEIKAYVTTVNESPQDQIWRVLLDDRHVGNIKLNHIQLQHKRSTVGIMLGDRSVWGKGVAARAIDLLARSAFASGRIHKLAAGIYASNLASLGAFAKANFVIEARLVRHRYFQDGFEDEIIMARFGEPPAADRAQ